MAEELLKKLEYSPSPVKLKKYEWKLEIRDTDDHTVTLPYMTRYLTIGIKNTLDQAITVKFSNGFNTEVAIPFDTDLSLNSNDSASVGHITWLDRPTLTVTAGVKPTNGYVYIVMICDAY